MRASLFTFNFLIKNFVPLLLLIVSIFVPYVGGYIYLSLYLIFSSYLFVSDWKKPNPDPSFWSSDEISIIKKYHIALVFPFGARDMSCFLNGFRFFGILVSLWLFWNHIWVPSGIFIVLFVITGSLAIKLDPFFYLQLAINGQHYFMIQELMEFSRIYEKVHNQPSDVDGVNLRLLLNPQRSDPNYAKARKKIIKAGRKKNLNLDLSNYELRNLPPEIGNLTTLESLDLGSNELISLPAEIGNLTCLKSLDLGNNELSSLPEEIGNLSSLESLDLCPNELIALPAEIENLTCLKSLNLCNNELTWLPEEIGDLTSLESLDLSDNELTWLPEEIGNLTTLESLDLGSNELSSLPEEIGNLTSLKSLGLCSNELTSLPEEIGNLLCLERLDLRINKLASLPGEIGNLTRADSSL
jgi:Leucine-rich repeat (LRR) protein